MLKSNYWNSFWRWLITISTYYFYNKKIRSFRENYNFFLEVINQALKQNEKNPDKFLDAFLLLSHKALFDLQSAFTLWIAALYGSAFCLCEVLLRTQRMTASLLLKPELIDDYLDEEKTSDKDGVFRQKFGEGSLKKILDERFGKEERGKYANMEKAVHGSSVGIKIYYSKIRYNEDGSKGGDITFDANYEPEKAGAIISILKALPIDMAGVFLEKYMDNAEVKVLMNKYWPLLKRELRDNVKDVIEVEVLDSLRKGKVKL